MKNSIKISFTMLSIFVITACSSLTKSEDPIEEGTNAPDFTLQSLDGGEVSLSDFSEKVVLLFFFGNTWPSCRAVAPTIESQLYTPYSDRTDYVVLGLDTWNGTASSVNTFKNTTNVTFPLLLNASSVAGDYGTTYDRLVLIDKTGEVIYSGGEAASNEIQTIKFKIDLIFD